MSGTEKDIILTSSRSNNSSNRKHSSSASQETSNIPQVDIESVLDLSHAPVPQTQFSDTAPHELTASLLHDSTSQKSFSNSKSRPPDKPVSFWLNTLCVIGTFTGITGFVLQFEGFRGISWACSIAQLVAIMIMTVVRAIIRRGKLDSPVAQNIPQQYEMDWLSLRIGNVDDYLQMRHTQTMSLMRSAQDEKLNRLKKLAHSRRLVCNALYMRIPTKMMLQLKWFFDHTL
ncbi:hypothetical protein BOTCAL_0083g00330 [Botryotinia calthae]|uniref:Uncharacterized protein n=1 Tax=Botryotinia calthae TaxID=38488 RepID=A0A4Y8D9Z2_9HELO|nr:hypothetical protein BOTCAL_0083g00330 [Botryotinia calthae]